jgi:hypothetical protein
MKVKIYEDGTGLALTIGENLRFEVEVSSGFHHFLNTKQILLTAYIYSKNCGIYTINCVSNLELEGKLFNKRDFVDLCLILFFVEVK